jgi:hypothetical protein
VAKTKWTKDTNIEMGAGKSVAWLNDFTLMPPVGATIEFEGTVYTVATPPAIEIRKAKHEDPDRVIVTLIVTENGEPS